MRAVVFTVLLMMTLAVWAQEQSPSLGDVARQKPTRKATRVVTNDEIPSKPEPPAETKPDAKPDTPAADTDKTKDATASKQPQNDPDLPESVRAAEKTLGEVRAQHTKAVDEIRDLQNRIDEASDNNVKEALTAQLEDKKQSEADLKKKMADADAQVTAARKAAGLPTGPAY